LRAVAILQVFLWHSAVESFNALSALEQESSPVIESYVKFLGFGVMGVNLFFIISGFLITGLILDIRDKKNGLRKFYIRRALRIFPLYYAALAVIFIILWFYDSESFHIKDRIFSYMFYLQNIDFLWYESDVTPFKYSGWQLLNHLWSLAVEEQFYIFWPIIVLWLTKTWRFKQNILLMLALIIFSVCLRYYIAVLYSWEYAYILLLSRMDALIMGGMVSYIIYKRPKAFLAIKEANIDCFKLLSLALIFLVAYSIYTGAFALFITKYTITFMNIFYLSLLIRVLGGDNDKNKGCYRRLFCSGFMMETARVSYGIYIIHVPVLYLLSRGMIAFGITDFYFVYPMLTCVGGMISFSLAYLSYHFYEKRFLLLKDKWAPLDGK